jgi:hypothetical protein
MTRLSALCVLGCLTWAPFAHGAGANGGPATAESTAPPTSTASGAKRSGFVAVAGLGPGLFSANSGSSEDTRHFSGATLSLELLIGGHLAPGFTLGAAYLRDQVYGLTLKDSSATATPPSLDGISFALSTLALFGDVTLPLKLPELHLQAFLGYGTLIVSGRPANAADVEEPSGLVLAGALSTEFRIIPQATLGLAARVTWAPLQVTEFRGTDVHTLIPALLVTARYD